MEKITFYKIAIGVLLLLNVGLLAFLLTRRPPPEPPFEFLSRKIGLDAAQQAEYKILREAHHAQIIARQQKNEDLHRTFFEMMTAPVVDSLRLRQLTDSIATIKKEEEIITFWHFRAVRGICRPEQVGQFDAVIFEAWQSMKPRRPRR